MTRFASALIREGLSRLGGGEERSAIVREEPPAPKTNAMRVRVVFFILYSAAVFLKFRLSNRCALDDTVAATDVNDTRAGDGHAEGSVEPRDVVAGILAAEII